MRGRLNITKFARTIVPRAAANNNNMAKAESYAQPAKYFRTWVVVQLAPCMLRGENGNVEKFYVEADGR